MCTAMSWASSVAAVGQLDEHGVHAAATLDVQVAVEDVAGGRLDAHDVAQLDLLLERDLEVLELRRPLGDGVGALGGDERRPAPSASALNCSLPATKSVSHLSLTIAPTLPSTLEGDDALVVLAVVALGAGRETLLAQPLLGRFDVAVGGLERLLGSPSSRRPCSGAGPGHPWR